MIREQPEQLYFDRDDIKKAHGAGFWSGVMASGTCILLAVGAVVLVFKL